MTSQKSFTTVKEAIEFDIDEELFRLLPGIAAGQMFEISKIQGRIAAATTDPDTSAGDVLMKELSKVFEPESFQRFEQRYKGEYNPIPLSTFSEVLEWIFGEALGKGLTPK